MKLTGRDAAQFCAKPNPTLIGALLYGPDSGLIADKRRSLISALLGPDADDMRLSTIPAADARKSMANVDDELRARGFFPGRRIVVIEGGTDGMGAPLKAILADISAEDAFLVVTAGTLTARSALRVLFEKDARLAALAFYPDAMSRQEIADRLIAAGAQGPVTPDALAQLEQIARDTDYGSFLQLIEKIGLSVSDQSAPLDVEAVLAQAPAGLEIELDRLVQAVANGQADQIGPLLRAMHSSGASAVQLVIMMSRHFRQLLRAACADGGPEAGIAQIRPPLFGPRRSAFAAQLRLWDQRRLETASRQLFETDSRLRSTSIAPDFAVIERCFLRLALMARRG